MTAYTAPPRAAGAAAAPRPAPRPLTPAETEAERLRLARALYDAVLTAAPQRASIMTGQAEPKYRDAKGHQLGPADVLDHLAKARTWAATLADREGNAVAGCRDYDDADAGELVAALDAAAARGLVAFAILMPGAEGEHRGGHLWALYRRPAPWFDVKAQLAALPGGRGEVYPDGKKGNAIRLPLGYHRLKETRGILVLQDGRRFDLDNGAELVAGLRAILSLQRNAAPPPAPKELRQRAERACSVQVDPALWEGITEELGGRLWGSWRYQKVIIPARDELVKIRAGARVTVRKPDGTLDDTGSAQIAALVYNLVRARRKGRAAGDGAPP